MKNLRILHILSPVRWNNDLFLHEVDSNFKVVEKTIEFLPNCHHYILVPLNHTIPQKPNVTFIRFDYPKSVHANRVTFDYRNIKLYFTKTDIDFVFNHQPELTYNVQEWLNSHRYFGDVGYIGFYHWIDCNQSRGSGTGSPTFYMRQLEAFHINDVNFVHSYESVRYLLSNFNHHDDITAIAKLISNYSYMPLSAPSLKIPSDSTPFELPKDKRILVFNHRFRESSGIKKLQEYTKDLNSRYVIWITDDRCEVKQDNFIIKRLNQTDYNYLMSQCHGSLCFIDGYTTWNMSIQDSIMYNKPCFCFDNDSIKQVLGENYPYYFNDKDRFRFLLDKIGGLEDIKARVLEHDEIFKGELLEGMNKLWRETKGIPKQAHAWMEQIKNGLSEKKQIANKVNPDLRLSGSNHYIRRFMLHNGIADDITEPYTTYYLEGTERVKKQTLFS